MSHRINKMDRMEYLIDVLNAKRQDEHKPLVKRAWTGAGHWLCTIEDDYHSVGDIFINDDEFIGFLEGLIFEEGK